MLQTILSMVAAIAPFAVAGAAWMRSVDGRLTRLEQGQTAMSLSVDLLRRDASRRAGELD